MTTSPSPDTQLLSSATFITADADRGAVLELTTDAVLEQERSRVARARLLATAHGIYDLTLDGEPVGDEVLAPGWTAYEWRLAYQVHDVTELVRAASPLADDGAVLRLAARVGNGWFRGDLGFGNTRASYGAEIALLAVLEIVYDDGGVQLVRTDDSWTARTCEITENSLYNGQRIEGRLRGRPGTPLEVRAGAFDSRRLVPRVAPPVRRQEVLRPRRVWTSPAGRTLVDFGQNLVGWVRVTVAGPAGTEIVLRHAEVLEAGELGTRPLRAARATDTFVLAGSGAEMFEPTFSFHGFRYAEVTGWPGEVDPDGLEAVVVHSDLRRTGTFTCSDPLIDQLVQNSVWSQKGNFLSVPTDCPQRDERLGWTGDIAAYAPTAAFQFDCADFLHGWLLDLAQEQRHHPKGIVPVTVPDVLKWSELEVPFGDLDAQAVWADAAVWVPRALWQAYGDRDRLAAHYPAMVRHLESVEPLLSPTGLWDQGSQLGDWLDPDAPPDEMWRAKADPGVVATASIYRSAAFTAEAARLVGRTDDAARWDALAARVRAAFRDHYVADRRITSDCTTVYALAICFGLLDDDECGWAADRLAELVTERAYRVTTGFAGTPFVTWALSEHGHVDTAYRLLLERDCPSWLYPITMGATTIWERWDSMLPDGSINPGEMTSFNHYALGAVADWIYQVVGGIRAAEPGYRSVKVQPVPGPGITWARTALDTRPGRIETSWRDEDDVFTLDVTVPDGVPAEIVLPDGSRHSVVGGRHTFTAATSPRTR